MLPYWRFVLILLFCFSELKGQGVVSRVIRFQAYQLDTSIQLGGNLDSWNTRREGAFTKIGFQPMKRYSISNLNDQGVAYPLLDVNKSKLVNIDTIRDRVLKPEFSREKQALHLWEFMVRNRVHASPPSGWGQPHNPVRFLNSFGYGFCDDIAQNSVTILNNGYYDQSVLYWIDGHVTASIKIDGQDKIIDSDIEVFYLDYDNKSLTSYEKLISDRYLISRTHHYGKSYQKNFVSDRWVGYIYGGRDETGPEDPHLDISLFDLSLRPGETFLFEEQQEAPKLAQYPDWKDPNTNLVLANAYLKHEVVFPKKLEEVFIEKHNWHWDYTSQLLRPSSIVDTAEFVYKVSSPFVLAGLTCKVSIQGGEGSDPITVLFSEDSLNWHIVEWKALGGNLWALDFEYALEPLNSEPGFEAWIKFEYNNPVDEANSRKLWGIESLIFETTLGLNNATASSWKLGNNQVELLQNNSNVLLNLEIELQEDFRSRAPQAVSNPIFPVNRALTQGSKFTFEWNHAFHPQGKEIIDYEFLVSTDSTFQTVYSPNFWHYTASYNQGQSINSFSVPWYGLFNNGETYFWRVRPLDQDGVWGEWSQVWCFKVETVERPTDLVSEIGKDSIRIVWNPALGGVQATLFHVYTSNESLGFTPDSSTFITTVTSPEIVMDRKDGFLKRFVRIVADDGFGNLSSPSDVLELNCFAGIPRQIVAKVNYPAYPIQKLKEIATFQLHYNLYRTSQVDTFYEELGCQLLNAPDFVKLNNFQLVIHPDSLFLRSKLGVTDTMYIEVSNAKGFLDTIELLLQYRFEFKPHVQAVYLPNEPLKFYPISVVPEFKVFANSSSYNGFLNDEEVFAQSNDTLYLSIYGSSSSVLWYDTVIVNVWYPTLNLSGVHTVLPNKAVTIQTQYYPDFLYHWNNQSGLIQTSMLNTLDFYDEGEITLVVSSPSGFRVQLPQVLIKRENTKLSTKSSTEILIGDSVTLKSAEMSETYTLQWFRNSQVVGSADSLIAHLSGDYYVVYSDTSGFTSTSDTITVRCYQPKLKANNAVILETEITSLMIADTRSQWTVDMLKDGVSWRTGSPSQFDTVSTGVYQAVIRNENGLSFLTDSVRIEKYIPKHGVQAYATFNRDTIVLDLDSVENYSWQWFRNGNAIPSTKPRIKVNETGYYYCLVTSALGNKVYSDTLYYHHEPTSRDTQIVELFCNNRFQLSIPASPDISYSWWINRTTEIASGSPSIWVSTSGLYELKITLPNGDFRWSHPFLLNQSGIPSIHLMVDSVESTMNISAPVFDYVLYRWYRNGVLISGEVGNNLIVREPGVYELELVDYSGRSCLSNSLNVNRILASSIEQVNTATIGQWTYEGYYYLDAKGHKPGQKGELIITDLTGKLVYRKKFILSEPLLKEELPQKTIPGIWILRTIVNSEVLPALKF